MKAQLQLLSRFIIFVFILVFIQSLSPTSSFEYTSYNINESHHSSSLSHRGFCTLIRIPPLTPFVSSLSFNLLTFHLCSTHRPILLHPDTDSVEYTPSFNPIALKDSALSTHKPIEVRGPGGKATIVHAQYNTPISMYSQDAIMDAIAGQSQAKGHDG